MRSILLSFLIIVVYSAAAQKNFQPGTVTTNDNTILNGYINYKEWDKNPSSVEFSPVKDEKDSRTFQVKDIVSFEITGAERYDRYVCRISMNNTELGRLSYGPDSITYREEQVLLKLLQKGKIALYRYADDLKQRFYIKTTDMTTPAELLNSMYYDAAATTRVIERKEYRDQLRAETEIAGEKNQKLAEKIADANYSENDLSKIVILMNSGGTAEKNNDDNKNGKVNLYAGAGVHYSTFSLKGDRKPFPTNEYSFTESVSPVVFGGVNLFFNPHTAKLFLRSELSLFFNSHEGKASTTDLINNYTYTFKLKYTVAALYIGPGINFIKTDKLNGYLSAGPFFQFGSNTENKEHQTTSPIYTFPPATEKDLPPLIYSSFWLSYNIRFGFLVNRRFDISLCISGEKGARTDYQKFSDQASYGQLHIGYFFNPKKK